MQFYFQVFVNYKQKNKVKLFLIAANFTYNKF